MDDLEQQRDEVQALSSIYGKDFVVEELAKDYQVYSMEFTNESKTVELKLTVKLPPTYPSQLSPSFELSSPYLNGQTKATLGQRVSEIFSENLGQPALYQCFEEVRDFIATYNQKDVIHERKVITPPIDAISEKEIQEKKFSFVTSDPPVIDRKSIFQGHATEVFSRNDVMLALQQLKLNTKIQRATHNIYAYRINNGNVWLQDCDDDGENQAGSRLLHLLQMTEAENVLIVVSRWYGGIHLGAARFKHINNAARQALEKHKNENGISAKNKKN